MNLLTNAIVSDNIFWGVSMKNILELLELNSCKFSNKLLFADENSSATFSEFTIAAKKIGCGILNKNITRKAVAIYLEKNVNCLKAMFGTLYSGCYYVVVDTKMPEERVAGVFEKIRPSAVICDSETAEKFSEFCFDVPVLDFDVISATEINENALGEVREKHIDTDPAYVIFTSGSTGKPKGTAVNHRSVLTYTEWFCKAFSIDENTVFGNQTPFYFSMSVSDVFATIRSGASFHIIPKKYFSFPVKLIEFLKERNVNTIYWVPSALSIVANWKTFDVCDASFIKKVLFAGEVMPTKQLNYWVDNIPDAMYANLFGPTETTDICCYYVLNRKIPDDRSVPIGKHCDNCECLIIGEDGKPADKGELYVRSSFVALGYINDPEKTGSAFVQNPLNDSYPEIVYKTGDIVKINEYGEMEYISRADSQIKHMGYRIELGEIEAAANKIDGISLAVVVYDKVNDRIVMAYQGKKKDESFIYSELEKYIPNYMMPTDVVRYREMPYNANGKVDRKFISENYNK